MLMLPPLAGIAPLPLIADAYMMSEPAAMRAAHAAISPIFGDPATPES